MGKVKQIVIDGLSVSEDLLDLIDEQRELAEMFDMELDIETMQPVKPVKRNTWWQDKNEGSDRTPEDYEGRDRGDPR